MQQVDVETLLPVDVQGIEKNSMLQKVNVDSEINSFLEIFETDTESSEHLKTQAEISDDFEISIAAATLNYRVSQLID